MTEVKLNKKRFVGDILKRKYVRLRHKIYFALARPIARIIAHKYSFKTKTVKLDKGKNFLILSNHQSYLDPAFIALTLKRPIYFVASDALFSQKLASRLLFHCFGAIKKRRGSADIACVRAMYNIAREGGTVALFPEGNRQWNDSVFYIDRSIVKLVRMLKLPVILYNFNGGYGVGPRWGKAIRKGKHVGFINRTLSLDEINAMTDDELYTAIISGLKVIDSNSGEHYRSHARAEYLERELFVCPKCGSFGTLVSGGNSIKCTSCGLEVEYREDLSLASADAEFTFKKLVDWYEFQQREIAGFDLDSREALASDDGVTLYDKTERKRVKLASGRLTLTKDALTVGGKAFSTDIIYGGCAQDGNKLSFNADGRAYIVVGGERFNSIKYLLFFNRVCKLIEKEGGDKYYGLVIDPERR